MKAIQRLFQYLENKGIKHTRLEKEVGLSNGYLGTQLKRSADLGEGSLNKILDYCLDLSPEWLLTGQGEMLKSNHSKHVAMKQSNNSDEMMSMLKSQQEVIKNLSETIKRLEKQLDIKKPTNSNFGKVVPKMKSTA